MILETKTKQVNLVLKTRSIIAITEILQDKNFENGFIKAYNECDVEALAKILYTIGEDTKGDKVFKSVDDVYDFLDELRKEKNMTCYDIYSKIAEVLNEEGFFKKKMTKEELKEMMLNPLSGMNMNEIIKNSTESAMKDIAKKEIFQGYQV